MFTWGKYVALIGQAWFLHTFCIFFTTCVFYLPVFVCLPAEGAIEAIVIDSATQAVGTEDVVAVQKTCFAVLLMTKVTDEGMEPVIVWIPLVIVREDDSSCHL